MSQNITEDLQEDISTIKEWLTHQQHLPQNIDEGLLCRFIVSCNRSLERSKIVIDLCYTVRSQTPEIFANRDPFNKELQNLMKMGDVLPLPKSTSKNYKLILFRMNRNIDSFVFADVLKIVLMVADVRLVSEKVISDGEVPIFDMAGMTLQHLTKVNLTTLRKYMLYTQEAHPIRLKAIHVINTPSFLDKAMLLVKPFIKGEVAAMLHFHTNIESLSKYIPLDLLPNEYGGKVGNLEDLKKDWKTKVESQRDYFLDESRWKVDESKRPANNKHNKPIFGVQGSFRALNID